MSLCQYCHETARYRIDVYLRRGWLRRLLRRPPVHVQVDACAFHRFGPGLFARTGAWQGRVR